MASTMSITQPIVQRTEVDASTSPMQVDQQREQVQPSTPTSSDPNQGNVGHNTGKPKTLIYAVVVIVVAIVFSTYLIYRGSATNTPNTTTSISHGQPSTIVPQTTSQTVTTNFTVFPE